MLLAFTERRPTRSVADLATDLSLPTSTVYRLLSVLRDEGMVEEVRRGEYRLTWTLVGVGRAARAAADPLATVARPVIEAVCDTSGETTLLISRIRHNVMCVDRVESHHPVRLQFDIGQPMSLHRGSAARVLLASMPPRERSAYLSTQQLTEAEQQQIDADVVTVARTGWVQSFGEVDDGIWGVSAAIRGDEGVVGALGLAGPLFRLDQADRERIIRIVTDGAAAIGEALRTGEPVVVPAGPPAG